MIERITVDNRKISTLENSFPQIFTKIDVNSLLVDNKFTQIFTYTENNKVVGIIIYDLIYERCELTQIEVLEGHRNRQIASKLLTHMIEDCRKNKIENITLEVKITNDPAINLYKKFGFEEVAIRKGYYQGIDAILMEKEMIE